MDRRTAPKIVSSRSMQALERSTLELLLQERAHQAFRVTADASCRRDLHSTAISWLAQDRSGSEERKLRRQSQACPTDYATPRASRQSAGTQHLKAASGAHQVSLFAARCSIDSSSRCLEHRYYVYPATKRVCIPCRHNRLVQPFCSVLSPLQQPGNELLPGRSRRSDRTARKTQNLQYRPRCAVYLERVRASDYRAGYSLQHGRPRSRIG